MSSRAREVLVIGFALFAMFFGAGNLIFPPSLGMQAGVAWLPVSAGFILTGVGMPLLGVLAFARVGDLHHWSDRVSPTFNLIFCTTLTLVIGPFFAIPRTGSTTYELGVLPTLTQLLGHAPDGRLAIIITSAIFFLISYLLCVIENKITDIIGKYLTPIILLILALIGIIGFCTTLGTPVASKIASNPFGYGFKDGYQLMDGLSSILFAVVIIKVLVAKGIKKDDQQGYLVRAGIIAALGLGSIYFILLYLGAQISSLHFDKITMSALYIANATLGRPGMLIFGICAALACLTTSVGAIAFVAEWLSSITRLGYKAWTLIISLFSAIVAVGGVDMIVEYAVPVLSILYPVSLVLILLNLFGVKGRAYFILGTYVTLIISIIEVAGNTLDIALCKEIVLAIPLGMAGFCWVVPFIVSLLLAYVITRLRRG